ncbi:hypothetical protein FNF31_00165 [Cafeteria roenbergensis]|uniref:Endoplasmic reticulum vesicle transporter C-terminal domain-containing protein n=1 Tax=Cafeteria roenbergensis TaxID=33653 RepID=A0A5A8DU66_CAFRO|nr:hypothetical protein FNF28_02698 [Cafeteria roenbergensis]KAA0169005.1 hypothetical protein FNF31_00165 [Cafeteria roenbergensis]
MRRRGAGREEDVDAFASSRLAPSKPSIIPGGLKQMDIFPKLVQDARERTTEGGAVFAVAMTVVLLLLLSEVVNYMTVTEEHHVRVDPTVGQKLRIEFDVTFHALHCGQVNLDAMDVTGEQQEPEDHAIFKARIGKDGKPVGSKFTHLLPWERQMADLQAEEALVPKDYCGSCYGAESAERKCCNTCEDVKAAYIDKGWNAGSVVTSAEQCKNAPSHAEEQGEEGEGCRLSGFMLVNKVAGNLNVAMGAIHVQDSRHIHQFNPADIPKYNVSHSIHVLRFGPAVQGINLAPLEGMTKSPEAGAGVYQYYLKVVPTVWLDSSAAKTADGRSAAAEPDPEDDGVTRLPGERVRTNQYSVKTFYRPAVVNGMRQNVLPGVFFVYDLSPFMVQVTTKTESLWELVTGFCAIIGGVVTISGMLDGLWFNARMLWSGVKAGLGKVSI